MIFWIYSSGIGTEDESEIDLSVADRGAVEYL